MPNFDGTGPNGQGAMSGCRQGACVSANQPNHNEKNSYGCGRRGQGFRKGFRCMQNENIVSLEDQAKFFQNQLDSVQKKIEQQKKDK